MPLTVELDGDVEMLLRERAGALEESLDKVGNAILRSILTQVARTAKPARADKLPVSSNKRHGKVFQYEFVVGDGVDPQKPGLYEWIVEGRGSYVGQYKRFERRMNEYQGNVRRLMEGKPYHIQGRDYRRVHRELRDAHLEGRMVALVLLENCELSSINQRERALIRERGALNGVRPQRRSGVI